MPTDPQDDNVDESLAGKAPIPITRLHPHLIAVLLVALATLARWALGQFLDDILPFITFFPAILFAAMLSPAAGVTAMVLGGLCGWFLFLSPPSGFGPPTWSQITNLVLYLTASGLIVFVAARWRAGLDRVKESELRLRRAYKAAGMGDWEWDLDSHDVWWSRSLSRVFGRRHERRRHSEAAFWDMIHEEDRGRVRDAIEAAKSGDSRYVVEYRTLLPDGETRWIVSRAQIMRDPAGRPRRIVGISYDVSGRKNAEQALHRAVEQRDLMLRELNHRVRNNFQIVATLLRLQAHRAASPETRAAIEQAVTRVMTVADLHATLYTDNFIGTIEFGDYLRNVCKNLSGSMLANSPITLDCTAIAARMPINRAVALGLVVNELVTNAIKHAFVEGARGEIAVELTRGDGGHTLVVRDNGRGLPPDLEDRPAGLGMQLVKGFVSQAEGTLEIRYGSGGRFEIWLPDQNVPNGER